MRTSHTESLPLCPLHPCLGELTPLVKALMSASPQASLAHVLRQTVTSSGDALTQAQHMLTQWRTQHAPDFARAIVAYLTEQLPKQQHHQQQQQQQQQQSSSQSPSWESHACLQASIQLRLCAAVATVLTPAQRAPLRGPLVALTWAWPEPKTAAQLCEVLALLVCHDCPQAWADAMRVLVAPVQQQVGSGGTHPPSMASTRALTTLHRALKLVVCEEDDVYGDGEEDDLQWRALGQHVRTMWSHVLQLVGQHWSQQIAAIGRTAAPWNPDHVLNSGAITALRIMRLVLSNSTLAPVMEVHASPLPTQLLTSLHPMAVALFDLVKASGAAGSDGRARLPDACAMQLLDWCLRVVVGVQERHPIIVSSNMPPYVTLSARIMGTLASHAALEAEESTLPAHVIAQVNHLRALVVRAIYLINNTVSCRQYQSPSWIPVQERNQQRFEAARDMIQSVFTPTFVEGLTQLLVNKLLPLKSSDMELWTSDPDQLVRDAMHDAFAHRVKPAAEYLFFNTLRNWQAVMMPVVLQMVHKGLQEPYATSLETNHILAKEVTYTLIALAPNELCEQLSFDDLLQPHFVRDCQVTDVRYRIIQRRIAHILESWNRSVTVTNMNLVYSMIVALMAPSRDIVVRMFAAIALRNVLDQHSFIQVPDHLWSQQDSGDNFEDRGHHYKLNILAAHVKPMLDSIVALLADVTESHTNMHVVHIIDMLVRIIREAAGPKVLTPFVNIFLNSYSTLWRNADAKNHTLRCAILQSARAFVNALDVHNAGAAIATFCPLLAICLNTNSESSRDNLLSDGFALWCACLAPYIAHDQGPSASTAPAPLMQLFTAVAPGLLAMQCNPSVSSSITYDDGLKEFARVMQRYARLNVALFAARNVLTPLCEWTCNVLGNNEIAKPSGEKAVAVLLVTLVSCVGPQAQADATASNALAGPLFRCAWLLLRNEDTLEHRQYYITPMGAALCCCPSVFWRVVHSDRLPGASGSGEAPMVQLVKLWVDEAKRMFRRTGATCCLVAKVNAVAMLTLVLGVNGGAEAPDGTLLLGNMLCPVLRVVARTLPMMPVPDSMPAGHPLAALHRMMRQAPLADTIMQLVTRAQAAWSAAGSPLLMQALAALPQDLLVVLVAHPKLGAFQLFVKQ